VSNEAYAASFAKDMEEKESKSPAAVAAREAAAEAYVKKMEAKEAYKQLLRAQYLADPPRSDCQRDQDGNCVVSGGRSRRRSRKTKRSRRSRK
jgi:hypothetical protein